jgi:hypothetical protein
MDLTVVKIPLSSGNDETGLLVSINSGILVVNQTLFVRDYTAD